eukprot:TRINITY_DN3149_c0_g1_i1.p1 TRINITY_DN3149_c0_g1~~TRINITY_DN3149_c0_g1_i1.p1  ORF type:complete len:535 (+),score=43.39 TRINITY_DN3149_c0_g1_i1:887-2491(+)
MLFVQPQFVFHVVSTTLFLRKSFFFNSSRPVRRVVDFFYLLRKIGNSFPKHVLLCVGFKTKPVAPQHALLESSSPVKRHQNKTCVGAMGLNLIERLGLTAVKVYLESRLGLSLRVTCYVAVGLFGTAFAWRRLQQRRLLMHSRQRAARKLEARNAAVASFARPTTEQLERFRHIAFMNIPQLLIALQRGEVSAEDAVRTYIYLACAAQQEFNCLADVMFTEALSHARELDRILAETGKPVGPLHGLPISIKENIGISGTDSTVGTSGNCFLEREDAVLIQVIREAGAVPFTKTNVPQTMLSFETSNPVYGRTSNPWNLDRTCGGSSGGEGALIAAGGSPVGIGSDIGGSIRIPCQFCGLYGIKPTSSRIALAGSIAVMYGQESIASSLGPMGTSVEDLAILCRVLMSEKQFRRDPDCGAPLPFNNDEFASTNKLKVGYYTYDGFFEPSHSCKRAVLEAVEALRAKGHTVIEFDPPNVQPAMEAYYYMLTADGSGQFLAALRNEDIDPSIATRRPFSREEDEAAVCISCSKSRAT